MHETKAHGGWVSLNCKPIEMGGRVWQHWYMQKRSSRDVNQVAARIVSEATSAGLELAGKNPAAVALGRLGGLKGGKARAEALSPKRRKKIASKAAAARWGKKKAEKKVE